MGLYLEVTPGFTVGTGLTKDVTGGGNTFKARVRTLAGGHLPGWAPLGWLGIFFLLVCSVFCVGGEREGGRVKHSAFYVTSREDKMSIL